MGRSKPLPEKRQAYKLHRPRKLRRAFLLVIGVKRFLFCVKARAAISENFVRLLEPMIRRVIREEVDKAMDRAFSEASRQTDYNTHPRFKLCLLPNLKDFIYTIYKIKGENDSPIQISMLDRHGTTVKSGPFASAKVKIVALHGDFCTDRREIWTESEFEKSIVSRRQENKEALLVGDLEFKLKNGVAFIRNAHFSDISRWARGGKFRFAVKLNENLGERVQEGISNPFIVKHRRGKGAEKVDIPSSKDEVWRLKKIAKDGGAYKELEKKGISTVGGLLESFSKDESTTKMILGPTWRITIRHAKKCDDWQKPTNKAIGGTQLEVFPSDNMLDTNLPYEDPFEGLDEIVSGDFAREQPQTSGYMFDGTEITTPAPLIGENYYHGSSSSQPDAFDHLKEPLVQGQVTHLEDVAIAENLSVSFDVGLIELYSHDLLSEEFDPGTMDNSRLEEIHDDLVKAFNGESVQHSPKKLLIAVTFALKMISITKQSAARCA